MTITTSAFCATSFELLQSVATEPGGTILLTDSESDPGGHGADPNGGVGSGAVLRVALPGITAYLSRRLAFVLGSLVVVESAVGWPGLGYLAWRAASTRDLPVLLGVALVMAVAVRVAWVAAEVLSYSADPRRRESR